MEKLILTQPDDWHLHVRNGVLLKTVIAHTARQFARAIIMPNLNPPITTVAQAEHYRQEILHALPKGSDFKPLMTLYLTDSTSIAEVLKAAQSEHIHAFKLYPAGATTNSDSGVTDLGKILPVLEAMQKNNIPLLIHGEVTDPKVDIFDREKLFIDQVLNGIITKFPNLRIVLEHVTTLDAVQFVEDSSECIAATITPQHLMFNRNALFTGGIRPHHFCLPVLKREIHREALLAAATGGNKKFFLGTDSAPHLQKAKENSCGCAGCYSAHAALEFYADIFEKADSLGNLEAFASFNGADFYRLPRNKNKVTLEKTSWKLPERYPVANDYLIPLKAGEMISWQLQ